MTSRLQDDGLNGAIGKKRKMKVKEREGDDGEKRPTVGYDHGADATKCAAIPT